MPSIIAGNNFKRTEVEVFGNHASGWKLRGFRYGEAGELLETRTRHDRIATLQDAVIFGRAIEEHGDLSRIDEPVNVQRHRPRENAIVQGFAEVFGEGGAGR